MVKGTIDPTTTKSIPRRFHKNNPRRILIGILRIVRKFVKSESMKEGKAGDGKGLGAKLSKAILVYVDQPLVRCMHRLTSVAIRRPWMTVWACIALSLLLFAGGLFTNFNVDTNEDTLYTPKGSRPLEHSDWIKQESKLAPLPRPFRILVHKNADNVLGVTGMKQAFEALDTLRKTDGYADLCPDDKCAISGVTRFWGNNYQDFVAQGYTTDEQIQQVVSEKNYPDGSPVDVPSIFGNAKYDNQGEILTSAESAFLYVGLPESEEAEDFEADAIENVKELREELRKGNGFQVEYFTERSFSDEFERAIVDDTALVPMVFIIMSVFTCFVFSKCDAVRSRSLLGFGAVCSVLMAILSGYGLLFLIGTPLTSMTQILPFIIFGIGLDDAFIITGAFFRTDESLSIEKRLHETIEEVGLSIFLTSFTSTLAFGLGAISSIPVVYWLCLYAFPTIIFDFIFQLTFFVAVLVIDERRIAGNRRDCCVCLSVTRSEEDQQRQQDSSFAVNVMVKLANFILMPRVRILIVLGFTGLFAFLAYSAAGLTQEFDFTDVVPNDSYVTGYWDNFAELSTQGGVTTRAYFRDVDQSTPQVQDQMENYINDLVGIKAISHQPAFFWLRDFKQYVADNNMENVSFVEQMDAFMGEPVFQDLYKDDIVRNEQGKVVESRVMLVMDNVDQELVRDQIDALLDQRAVGEAQPINQERSDWAFFTFDPLYFIWEFYAAARDELILTTIVGIVAVTLVAFCFVPHWSAALFVFPLISMCYIDMLGKYFKRASELVDDCHIVHLQIQC